MGGGGDRRDVGGGVVGYGGRGFRVFWKVRGGGGATSGVVNDFERGLGLRLLAECERELGSDPVVYLRLSSIFASQLRFFFFFFVTESLLYRQPWRFGCGGRERMVHGPGCSGRPD